MKKKKKEKEDKKNREESKEKRQPKKDPCYHENTFRTPQEIRLNIDAGLS